MYSEHQIFFTLTNNFSISRVLVEILHMKNNYNIERKILEYLILEVHVKLLLGAVKCLTVTVCTLTFTQICITIEFRPAL